MRESLRQWSARTTFGRGMSVDYTLYKEVSRELNAKKETVNGHGPSGWKGSLGRYLAVEEEKAQRRPSRMSCYVMR